MMVETPGESPRLRIWALVTVAISLILAIAVMYAFSEVFAPLILALALAYSLEPLVVRLQRAGWRRLWAVSGVLVGIGLCGLLLLAFLTVEATLLVQELHADGRVGRGLRRALDWVMQITGSDSALPADLADRIQASLPKLNEHIPTVTGLLKGMLEGVLQAFSTLSMMVLLPVYTFYFMLDLPGIWRSICTHLPKRDRDRSLRVCARLHASMSAFMRGRMLLALLKGVVTVIGLLFCGTQMAVVVGLGAGFLAIIPVLGPALAFAIALALTLAEGVFLGPVLGVVAVFVIAEVLENFVLTPLVMRDDADLHPLVLIFCVVFWGVALGAFGALLAIPLTLGLRVLYQEYFLPALRDLAELDSKEPV